MKEGKNICVVNSTLSREQYDELSKIYGQQKMTFINAEGVETPYVKGDDYCYHSYMTNEEWLKRNNAEQFEACKKCSLWESCKTHEHTIMTYECLAEKCTDELTHYIDQRILTDMKEQNLF